MRLSCIQLTMCCRQFSPRTNELMLSSLLALSTVSAIRGTFILMITVLYFNTDLQCTALALRKLISSTNIAELFFIHDLLLLRSAFCTCSTNSLNVLLVWTWNYQRVCSQNYLWRRMRAMRLMELTSKGKLSHPNLSK